MYIAIKIKLFTFVVMVVSVHAPMGGTTTISPVRTLQCSSCGKGVGRDSILRHGVAPTSLTGVGLSERGAGSVLAVLSLSLNKILIMLVSAVLISCSNITRTQKGSFPANRFGVRLGTGRS